MTTLIGINDAGKTTILRGLQWIAFNDPTGKEHINWDSKAAIAIADIDGHKIVRKRSDKDNYYKIDGKRFNFDSTNRTQVPEPIAALLNLSEINFQNETDPIFLLSESPGQVSRKLNSVINLEEIDRILADAGKDVREAKLLVTVSGDRVRDARAAKRELAWVVQFDKDLTEIEDQLQNCAELESEIHVLETIIKEARELEKKASIKIPSLKPLLRNEKKCEKLIGEINDLSNMRIILYHNESSITELDKIILQKEKRLRKLTKRRCPTCLRPWTK